MPEKQLRILPLRARMTASLQDDSVSVGEVGAFAARDPEGTPVVP
jgi:hypothetical protein